MIERRNLNLYRVRVNKPIHSAPSSQSYSAPQVTRRSIARGAAWSVPTIAIATVAPAYAASNTEFGVVFNGGGGANGYLNSMYLDFGTAAGAPGTTLTQPVEIAIQVVGLLSTATAERDYSVSSSFGVLRRGAYNTATRTTTITWTLPAGTALPTVTASNAPDILFSFRDGASPKGRITNKVVVTGVRGTLGNPDAGEITTPTRVPVDSSVVKDKGGISPDGIY